MIRSYEVKDAKAITRIYNHYIDNSNITFETQQICADDMASRIQEILVHDLPYLVFEDDNKVQGFAYANKWKGRCAYRFTVESTIYLAPNAIGKQYGTKLYQELFRQLKQLNYRTVLSGISLPNPASIALHKKMGMEKVAHFKKVGFKFDQWIDVGYWQKIL